MIFLKDKLLIILTQIMISVIDVANLFIADIIIYETTSGFSFDYGALLHNLLFWVLLLLHLVHIILVKLVLGKSSSNDQVVEKAIENEQIKILSQVTQHVESGKFEKARQVIKIYDKLARRRNK